MQLPGFVWSALPDGRCRMRNQDAYYTWISLDWVRGEEFPSAYTPKQSDFVEMATALTQGGHLKPTRLAVGGKGIYARHDGCYRWL